MKRVQSVGKVLCVSVLVGLALPQLMAQANVGQWTMLLNPQTGTPLLMPINPIHATLLSTGKVLVVAGSGNYPPNKNYQAAVWDPKTGTITVQTCNPQSSSACWYMLGNGAVALPAWPVFLDCRTTQYNAFQ